MACRLGVCEINNNRPFSKKPSPQRKKERAAVVRKSSPDWSDSDSGSCSGCSACWEMSSSCCSCSECDMGTDSSDELCCKLVIKSKNKKKVGSARKVLKCRDGVCELVPRKKMAKPGKPKKTPVKNGKEKNEKPAKK